MMSKKNKRVLVRIIIAAIGLAGTMLSPLEGYWRLIPLLPVYLLAGGDVLLGALGNIRRGQVFDENFLMSIATIGAFCVGEYPEGVMVMLFYQVGELFQSYAVVRSRRSIAALMDIRPDYANVERDGELFRVDPEEVAVGDTIVVKAGERIPLDGVVTEGRAMADTSALTGESVPRGLAPGGEALSGCINLDGVLSIRVTKPFAESTVSRILDLVENAGSKKARTENFITRFARYYTPCVVIAAVLLAFLPPMLLEGALFSEWVRRALTFLVISCPCALVISVPLGFFGGIGSASRHGILVKGSNYLEALARAEIVVFDKTGTLTKGTFRVTEVCPAAGMDRAQLLEMAALAESYSGHPISLSLKREYGREPDRGRVENAREIAGNGVQALVDGREVLAGNTRLMAGRGVPVTADPPGTVVHVAVEGEYAGYIVIADEVKEEAAAAVADLKRRNGVRRTVMLTGDGVETAHSVGERLGIDHVFARLLPADKVDRVEDLLVEKNPGNYLAFVGDGINDAPVLARADIGVAMGGLGSDAAIEAADVVLMDDRLTGLNTAIGIARKTTRIVRQNIVFALGVKGFFLLLGALGYATMWEAVFADVGVSVLAILNAMRALRYKTGEAGPNRGEERPVGALDEAPDRMAS